MLGAGTAPTGLDGALVSMATEAQRLVVRLIPEQRAAALMRHHVIDDYCSSCLPDVSLIGIHTDGVLGKVALPISLPSRVVSAFAAATTRFIFPRTLLLP